MSAAVASPSRLGDHWPDSLLLEVSLLAVDRVASTQTLARRLLDRHLAEDEDPGAFAILALEQTAGRGRHGRSWASAPGLGIWASLVVRSEAADAFSLPMRSAVALAELLGDALGARCGIKWPNDLVIDRRKVGGLLVDLVSNPTGSNWAVIGFGVNHGHAESDLPVREATSLRLAAAGRTIPALEELAGRAVAAVWRECAPERRTDWLGRYRELSVHVPGSRIVCDLAEGRVEGRFAGFDERGFLQLEVGSERRSIRSGEVFAW